VKGCVANGSNDEGTILDIVYGDDEEEGRMQRCDEEEEENRSAFL